MATRGARRRLLRPAAAAVIVAGTAAWLGALPLTASARDERRPAPPVCAAVALDALVCDLLTLPPSLGSDPPAAARTPATPAATPAAGASTDDPAAAATAGAAQPGTAVLSLSDPLLLQLIDLITGRPVSRPQLLHFRPAAVDPLLAGPEPPTLVGGCGAGQRCLAPEVPLRAGAAGLLLVLAAAVLAGADPRRGHRWASARALLALAGAGAVGIGAGLMITARAPATSPVALGASVARAAAELSRPAAAGAPGAAAAAGSWGRLVELERRLSTRPDAATLESEYGLYRQAVTDPAARAVLVGGATGSGIPGAPGAVLDNLDAIAAELADEAVIADAQERLARYSGLQPVQLRAIEERQPLLLPEVAPVSQWFGPSDLWMEPPRLAGGIWYPHFHTGIDLAAPLDTPIHAAADGVVISAGTSTDGAGRPVGYGNYIVIAHSATVITLYGHLDRLAVAAGDQVRQGQVIGLEGSTGMSTGPHLHFELREDGVPVDPRPALGDQIGATP
ncbi:MAG TPA: M23 family metallopeptidase [Candidatus Dormibacteraeota bacterium]|nr:M23 family metallopeptidase [Candidatus Dormibacteraeota bacterium]